mgnify:CR=1 FL=1
MLLVVGVCVVVILFGLVTAVTGGGILRRCAFVGVGCSRLLDLKKWLALVRVPLIAVAATHLTHVMYLQTEEKFCFESVQASNQICL